MSFFPLKIFKDFKISKYRRGLMASLKATCVGSPHSDEFINVIGSSGSHQCKEMVSGKLDQGFVL